jgi:tetratricopeptide (TPR) repeat protein
MKSSAQLQFARFSHMRKRLNPYLVWVAGLMLTALSVSGADGTVPDPQLDAAWLDLATLKVSDAHAAFENGYKKTGSQESAYGLALSLLNLQPKTNRNIERAQELLRGLAARGKTDDIVINARYFLARIDQVHLAQVDPEAAIEAYRRLLEDFPDQPLAEKAVPKLASILLIRDLPNDEWEVHFDEVSALLDQLTISSNRAATQLVLIEALLRIKTDHIRALPILVDLLDSNPELRADLRRDFVVQAIDSARALGEDRIAADFAARFLKDYAYDPRAGTIQTYLEESVP